MNPQHKYPFILFKYLTRDLLLYFFFALLCFIVLIFFIDLIELFRRASDKIEVASIQKAKLTDIIGMAALKIPSNIEKILSFAALIGSIACFNQWRKKNYYVVSRSFGISLWKIISPALISFFIIGLISITFVNPLSSILNQKYDYLQTIFFNKKNIKVLSFDTKGFWVKETSEQKQLIINANKIDEKTNILLDVNIFVFDKNQLFEKRISAQKAIFSENLLILTNVETTSRETNSEKRDKYSFSVKSNSSDFNVAISEPDSIYILELPSYIVQMEKYGLKTSNHLLHLFKLICQPFLILAMILLSASLMLRSSERKVEIGIVSFTLVIGFSLYFIGDFIFALGSSEKLPPVLSGFGPTFIGLFSGCYLISDIDEPKKI